MPSACPAHAGSPVQRPLRFCTLNYYLDFLRREIDRLPTKPILIGHSMGGALTQWYLKKVADDLPAAVLVASWTSHSTYADGLLRALRRDPVGAMLVSLTGMADPYVRNPQVAAKTLISDNALYSPEELHQRLGSESALVLNQYNPPLWSPAKKVNTPMLWLTAEKDTVIGSEASAKSAAHYGAEHRLIRGAAHNLMMEHNQAQTAREIADWLEQRDL